MYNQKTEEVCTCTDKYNQVFKRQSNSDREQFEEEKKMNMKFKASREHNTKSPSQFSLLANAYDRDQVISDILPCSIPGFQ